MNKDNSENNHNNNNADKNVLMSFAENKVGRMVSINESENGKKCECICSSCKEPVIARQGNYNLWHFAHASGKECANSSETSLHQAAKQLLLDESWMMLPSSYSSIELSLTGFPSVVGAASLPSRRVNFSSVELEKDVGGGRRPDLIAFMNGAIMYVEVAVTHFIDEKKLEWLKEAGIPTIEVNLSTMDHDQWDWDLLREHLIAGVERKKWIVEFEALSLQKKAIKNALELVVDNADNEYLLIGHSNIVTSPKKPGQSWYILSVVCKDQPRGVGSMAKQIWVETDRFEHGNHPDQFPRPIELEFDPFRRHGRDAICKRAKA